MDSPFSLEMFHVLAGLNTALLLWILKGQSELSNRVSKVEGKLNPYKFTRLGDIEENESRN